MKPTQTTELLANIKATFVSFFSILMFVALGVAVFTGISWTSPALQRAALQQFDEGGFHHFQVTLPYGLSADDVEQLAGVEGVSALEAGRASFQQIDVGGNLYTLRLQQVGERIDVLDLVEGALPADEGDIVLLEAFAREHDLHVGDAITFEHDATDGGLAALLMEQEEAVDAGDDDGMEYLVRDRFTVCGIANSPEYLSTRSYALGYSTIGAGALDGVGWVSPEVFDADAFFDGFNVVNVRAEALGSLDSFGADYEAAAEQVDERIAALGDVLSEARCNDLYDRAVARLDENQATLNRARADLDEGQQKIAEGKSDLATGRGDAAQGERDLADAKKQLEQQRAEGQKRLDDAKKQLDDTRAQLETARAELAEAQGQLRTAQDALSQADAAEAQANQLHATTSSRYEELNALLAAGEITREEYGAQLDQLAAQARDGIARLYEAAGEPIPAGLASLNRDTLPLAIDAFASAPDMIEQAEVSHAGDTVTVAELRAAVAEGQQKVAQGQQEVARGEASLEEGQRQYDEGVAELAHMVAEAEEKIAQGERDLADAHTKLDDAEKEIAQSERDLSQGEADYAEGAAKLRDARVALNDFVFYGWTVTGRGYNGGVQLVGQLGGVTDRLRFTMAALFVIVGLLVCYSAISRIVHEQVSQIGTKKALGLRGREITLSYLLYAGLAVLAGVVIGVVAGATLVELIIARAVGESFTFGAFAPYASLLQAAGAAAIELVLILAATWLACRGILRKHAVELLRGEAPTAGKQRFFEKCNWWDRLPLLTQTIVNNTLNDKRRVFSTVVGVAGATALIVTAITLNNDVLDSFTRHYEDVYHFDAIAYVDASAEQDKAAASLAAQGCESASVYRASRTLDLPDGTQSSVRVVVPADEAAFAQLYTVRNAADNSEVDLAAETGGVWMAEAFAEHFGAKVGDEVTVYAVDGTKARIPIAGFMKNYVSRYEMVFNRSFYEGLFGELHPNARLVDTGTGDVDAVRESLAGAEGIAVLVNDRQENRILFDTFASVSSAVVLIYLALSVLMSIVVLLNLLTMFIDEKKRELIVLMINGFSAKQAKGYISGDTIVLVALGIVLGIVLGAFMGSLTVASVEPSNASFLKDFNGMAAAAGVVGSAALSLAMLNIALRRIPRFELTDINRL